MRATAKCNDCDYQVTVEESDGRAQEMVEHLIYHWHVDQNMHSYDVHTTKPANATK